MATLKVDDKFKLNAFARAKAQPGKAVVEGNADSAWDD